MEKKNRISNQQLKALLVTTVIGIGILSLPSEVAVALNNDGWIAILIGGLIPVPFIMIMDRLFKMYPKKSYFQITKEVMSPFVAYIFFIVFFIYTIVVIGYIHRVFAEVIKAYLLENTPIKVILITMLVAVSYAARSRLEVLARVAVMIYPIILGFPIFLLVVNLPNLDYTNILPIFQLDIKQIPNGIFTAYSAYLGFEITTLAFNITEDNTKSVKYTLRGLFTVIGVYLIVFFVTLSQYGVFQLKRGIWPSIDVIKEVDLPGYFVENLDGIVLAIWVLVVYSSLGPFFHTSGIILKEIFNTKTHEVFIPFLIPITFVISIIPDNLVVVTKVMARILEYLAFIVSIILPVVIFIVAYIKKRRVKT